MKHYLFNSNYDRIDLFESFNRELIRAAIVKYLTANPAEMLTHERECKDKRTVGNDILNVFINHNGRVCKVVTRGNREFNQPI